MPRISAQERKRRILDAATPLFARRGVEGVTTREIAACAGVSEALLYKHFSSKDEIYRSIVKEHGRRVVYNIAQLEPSTENLVFLLYLLISTMDLNSRSSHTVVDLMLASLQSDGDFTRSFFKTNLEPLIQNLSAFQRAAHASGDLPDLDEDSESALWFSHHLMMALILLRRPKKPASSAAQSGEALVRSVVRFCLRGMGLKPEAIRKYFKPARLEARAAELRAILEESGEHACMKTPTLRPRLRPAANDSV